MEWLGLIRVLLGVVRNLTGYLQDRQLIAAGEAKALKEVTDEALELAQYASRVDRDTDSLSPAARQRVRTALRELRGS